MKFFKTLLSFAVLFNLVFLTSACAPGSSGSAQDHSEELEETKKSVIRLDEELTQAKSEKAQIEADLAQARKALQAAAKPGTLAAEKQQLEQQLAASKTDVQRLQQDLKKAQVNVASRQKLEEDLQKAKISFTEIQNTLNMVKINSDKELQQKEQKITKLTQGFNEQKATSTQLQEQLNQAQKTHMAKTQEAQNEIIKIKEELADKDTEIAKLKANLDLAKFTEEVEKNQQEKIKSLEDELKEANAKVTEKEQALKAEQDKLLELEKQLNAANAEAEDKEQSLKAEQDKVAQLEKEQKQWTKDREELAQFQQKHQEEEDRRLQEEDKAKEAREEEERQAEEARLEQERKDEEARQAQLDAENIEDIDFSRLNPGDLTPDYYRGRFGKTVVKREGTVRKLLAKQVQDILRQEPAQGYFKQHLLRYLSDEQRQALDFSKMGLESFTKETWQELFGKNEEQQKERVNELSSAQIQDIFMHDNKNYFVASLWIKMSDENYKAIIPQLSFAPENLGNLKVNKYNYHTSVNEEHSWVVEKWVSLFRYHSNSTEKAIFERLSILTSSQVEDLLNIFGQYSIISSSSDAGTHKENLLKNVTSEQRQQLDFGKIDVTTLSELDWERLYSRTNDINTVALRLEGWTTDITPKQINQILAQQVASKSLFLRAAPPKVKRLDEINFSMDIFKDYQEADWKKLFGDKEEQKLNLEKLSSEQIFDIINSEQGKPEDQRYFEKNLWPLLSEDMRNKVIELSQ